jgi:hypothetical protein
MHATDAAGGEHLSPAIAAQIMVVATVVAPFCPVARYVAISLRLTLPTFFGLAHDVKLRRRKPTLMRP